MLFILNRTQRDKLYRSDCCARLSRNFNRVVEGTVDGEVLKEVRDMGLVIEELDKNSRFAQGLRVGITINPLTGELETASPSVTNGAEFAR